MPYRTTLLGIVLCLVFTAGCGDHIRVRGTVAFPDQTPLETGVVNFQSTTHIARGTIQKGGRFEMGSLRKNDGLPPGEYKIFITGADTVKPGFVPNPKNDDPGLISLIDEKFTSADKTPLMFEIPGEKVYNITVERP